MVNLNDDLFKINFYSYKAGEDSMTQKYFFYFRIFLIFIFPTISYIDSCLAQDRMRGPSSLKIKNNYEEYGKGNNTFLNIYQKWISPVKGGNKCPMYPSCSQYAKIAFQKLAWYNAYFKSCERILRCGNELYLYRTIQINGIIRWYDPLSDKKSKNEDKINNSNV